MIAKMTWGEMGQLMAGIGIIITALCAGATLIVISLQQKRKQWVDDFRALYAEFWKDNNASQVRMWIVSDKLYNDVLKSILKQRNAGCNDLDEGASIILDRVDRFISLILQLETFEKMRPMTARQRSLIKRLSFSKYWRPRAMSRPELADYISKYWKNEFELK